MDENRIAQPITHAVDEHLAAIDHELKLIFVVLQSHILAFDHRIGEAVEVRDIIDTKEIAPINLDHLPLDGRANGAGKDHGKNGADDQAPVNHCGENFTKSALMSG